QPGGWRRHVTVIRRRAGATRRSRLHGERRSLRRYPRLLLARTLPLLPAEQPEQPPGADGALETTAAEGHLYVAVTKVPEPEVKITHAPPDPPGLARGAACRPDGNGGTVWTQATVSSEREPDQILIGLPATAGQ